MKIIKFKISYTWFCIQRKELKALSTFILIKDFEDKNNCTLIAIGANATFVISEEDYIIVKLKYSEAIID